MNWRFTFNQNNSGHSKKEIFDDYEQKYLKKLNKIKSEIQKIQNKQKEIELNELKDRIARRLKLEKKSGKNYKKLLLKQIRPKNEIKTNVESELKRKNRDQYSIQKRISDTIKRISNPQKTESTIAEDTRNFVRKRRTERIDDTTEVIRDNKSVNKQIKKEEENEKLRTAKLLEEFEEKEKEHERFKIETEKLLKDNSKNETFSGDSYQDFLESKEKVVKTRVKKPKTEKESKEKVVKTRVKKPKTKKEIKKEIAKLEKKLGYDEEPDFIKTTLETAVSEGWTKTKTVAELRKSKERITVKKAKEITKEAFEKNVK